MITLAQYIGVHAASKDWTTARQTSAMALLASVNALMLDAIADHVVFLINPKTGNQISGQTFGGFRPQNCPQGAPNSNHKKGKAIDLYDPYNQVDQWCAANLGKLEKHGIWIEHPDDTPTWSHWQSVPPRSGNRMFKP